MDRYYSDHLAARRLQRCYQIAPPRVRQYLDAEIDFVLEKISPCDVVLELGCGYGRVLRELAPKAKRTVGIDTSRSSLELAREVLKGFPGCHLVQMDAVHLAFHDDLFNLTVCIQNGLSAFQVNPLDLMRQSVRVTRPGGAVFFSSYSDKFWSDRLEWFQMQAWEGLLGEIDPDKTGDGVIVCRDGFRATTLRPEDFLALTAELGLHPTLTEVDESSLFCEIIVCSGA